MDGIFCVFVISTSVLLFLVGIISLVRAGYLEEIRLFDPVRYEWMSIYLVDDSGKRLAEISVRVADTQKKRYVGLSKTDSLSPQEGMLFLHDSMDTQVYVMRDMKFSIDIIFISADGRVTSIQEGERPIQEAEKSDLKCYCGEGQYVLELPRGTTSEVGLNEGDWVVIPDSMSRFQHHFRFSFES